MHDMLSSAILWYNRVDILKYMFVPGKQGSFLTSSGLLARGIAGNNMDYGCTH